MLSHGHCKRVNGRTTESPTHKSWSSMKERCYRESHPCYHRYGGRGIIVCDEWLGPEGFANFLRDLGERPSLYHSLEREKVDEPYCKDNCKWADKKAQANNRSTNHLVEINGEKFTLQEAQEKFGGKVGRSTVWWRIVKCGWDPLLALTMPSHKGKRKTDKRTIARRAA